MNNYFTATSIMMVSSSMFTSSYSPFWITNPIELIGSPSQSFQVGPEMDAKPDLFSQQPVKLRRKFKGFYPDGSNGVEQVK